MIFRWRPSGPDPDPRREAYRDSLDIPQINARDLLTQEMMDQLDRCKDNAARRLLLKKNARVRGSHGQG
jgi:hypothetical protein